MSNRKRIISLFIVCIFIFATGLAGFSALRSGQKKSQRQKKSQKKPPATNDREALAKNPAPSGTLKDRLDVDDGYSVVFFFSSTVHGSLEVCGCPIHPKGGMARRMGYINAFKERSPDAAILQVDAGYIFNDTLNDKGQLREDADIENGWMIKYLNDVNFDIVNLSYHDISYAKSLLIDSRQRLNTKLISSNFKFAPEFIAPYVIKEVSGNRLKKPVRIAFIGVTEPAPTDNKDITIADPLESVKAAITEVSEKADLTVVLGYLSLPTAGRIAAANDDLDLIISSDDRGLITDPREINNALLIRASKETKHLGELRLYSDPNGEINKFTVRYIDLDKVIPDDPAIAELTAKARVQIAAAQRREAEYEAKAYAELYKSSGMADKPSQYVLSETCAKCHQAEYEVWKKSRHSHAFAALETKDRIFDSACIGCHSLGYQKEGFVNIIATPQFANVQCESCHGPGANHAAKPIKGNYKTPTKNESCLVCHDRENSPDFDFKKYWPVIKHTNSLNLQISGSKKR